MGPKSDFSHINIFFFLEISKVKLGIFIVKVSLMKKVEQLNRFTVAVVLEHDVSQGVAD